jgi:hypothetical protein
MSEPKKCAHPDCTSTTIFSRNFCNRHYLVFVRDCKLNGSWRPYDQRLHQKTVEGLKVERKTWLEAGGWKGDEDALAQMIEEEKNKNEK